MSFQKASLRSSALGVRFVLIDNQAYQVANINSHDPRALFLKYRDQEEEVRRRRKLPQTSSRNSRLVGEPSTTAHEPRSTRQY